MLSSGLMCPRAPQISLTGAADGDRSSAFPQKCMGTDRSRSPRRSGACPPPPAWLRWGDKRFPTAPWGEEPSPALSRPKAKPEQGGVAPTHRGYFRL